MIKSKIDLLSNNTNNYNNDKITYLFQKGHTCYIQNTPLKLSLKIEWYALCLGLRSVV